jgi:hypothetical protein
VLQRLHGCVRKARILNIRSESELLVGSLLRSGLTRLLSGWCLGTLRGI